MGISQQEADKEDFHFVCHDCKRREEDAKKPKIPSLKFRFGSSTSPPNQKPKVVVSITNEAGKGISEDSNPEPSAKKAKHPSHPQPAHKEQKAMHASVINGPTLSPQSQLSQKSFLPGHQPYSVAQTPSEPQFPPSAPAHTNGYNHHHPTYPNGYGSQAPNQSFQPPPFMSNGYRQGNQNLQQGSYQAPQAKYHSQPLDHYQPSANTYRSQQHPGWSARYVPPSPIQRNAQSHSPHGPPPADQNPFANTLNDHRSSSSHLPASAHRPTNGNTFSSMKSDQWFSPTQQQYQTPSSSFAARPSSSSTTPQVNGYPTDTNGVGNEPVGPPSHSPTKQASSPTTYIPQPLLPTSSPIAHQPALQANGPTSPGFSPVKHSPPRQQAVPPGHGIAGTSNVLAPVTKLGPSLLEQSFVPPAKELMPEKAGQTRYSEDRVISRRDERNQNSAGSG